MEGEKTGERAMKAKRVGRDRGMKREGGERGGTNRETVTERTDGDGRRSEEAVRAEILVSAVDSPQRFNSFDVHEFAAPVAFSQLLRSAITTSLILPIAFPVTFQRP